MKFATPHSQFSSFRFKATFRFFAFIIGSALAASSMFAISINIAVLPEGDGHSHRARYGTFDTWNNYPFVTAASPNKAHHEFASGWGEINNAFLQFSLAALEPAMDIVSAHLNLHVTHVSGSGSSLRHVSDASGATGLASQSLAGDVAVADLTQIQTGWISIDVTPFIANDLLAEHAWAAFSLPSKSYSSFFFSSAEGGGDFAPYLAVQVIPEPEQFGLIIVLGLAGIVFGRRRERRCRG